MTTNFIGNVFCRKFAIKTEVSAAYAETDCHGCIRGLAMTMEIGVWGTDCHAPLGLAMTEVIDGLL